METESDATALSGRIGHATAPGGGLVNVAAQDALLLFAPGFLDPSEGERLLRELIRDAAWEQHWIRIFGRRIACPRLSAWYGEEGAIYAYSGLRLVPNPWLPPLDALRSRIEEALGAEFNSVLVNRYRDGRDSMGWHADDEPELGDEPVIASLSLGATRVIRFRHVASKTDPVSLELTNGSLLVMAGATQRYWRHEIPKTRRKVGERLNLTFRLVLSKERRGPSAAFPHVP